MARLGDAADAAKADDIEPMDPTDIPVATRNGEVREILSAANQTIADQLKERTDMLLDSVLYAASMKMNNAYNRSDN